MRIFAWSARFVKVHRVEGKVPKAASFNSKMSLEILKTKLGFFGVCVFFFFLKQVTYLITFQLAHVLGMPI